VAHTAPRHRPDEVDQPQHEVRETQPAEFEIAQWSSRYPLQHESLMVRVLDQLERLGDSRQAAAAAQQVELATCILAALLP
jgi:hypothetical protein